jgi:hypothetical protein
MLSIGLIIVDWLIQLYSRVARLDRVVFTTSRYPYTPLTSRHGKQPTTLPSSVVCLF